MTAPRTCRACSAPIHGHVMWCLRCYEPVRQLTPRDPGLAPLPVVAVPRDERPRSRWMAGANTFGPVGRITITVIVLLFVPTSLDPFSLFISWPCYLALAIVILRGTWKNDIIDLPGAGDATAEDAPREGIARLARAEAPAEPLRAPIPRSTIIAWVVLALLAGVLGVVWADSGNVMRGSIGIGASLTALVLWFVWIARS